MGDAYLALLIAAALVGWPVGLVWLARRVAAGVDADVARMTFTVDRTRKARQV